MSKKLNENDIRAIVTGSALLGAGGGGSLKAAFELLDTAKKQFGELSVELIDSSEMAAGGYASVITGYYISDVVNGKTTELLNAGVNALVSIRQSAYISGKRIDAVMPMDCGALSAVLPALACAYEGLPLIDADGCGRGAADLSSTMFESGNITFSPAVICDGKGNVVRVYPYNAADCKAAENMTYYFRSAFDGVSALGAWLCNAKEIETNLVRGSLSLAEKIGKVILQGADTEATLKHLAHEFALSAVASGKVIEKDSELILFETDSGDKYTIKYGRSYKSIEGSTSACNAPALICAIDSDSGLPVPSDDIRQGQRICWLVKN